MLFSSLINDMESGKQPECLAEKQFRGTERILNELYEKGIKRGK